MLGIRATGRLQLHANTWKRSCGYILETKPASSRSYPYPVLLIKGTVNGSIERTNATVGTFPARTATHFLPQDYPIIGIPAARPTKRPRKTLNRSKGYVLNQSLEQFGAPNRRKAPPPA